MKSYHVLSAAAVVALAGSVVHATPYASGVAVSGTAGTFVLNENADSITITYGNNTTQTFGATGAGTISFALPSASSTFSISVNKAAAAGYTTVGAAPNATTFGTATKLQISSDATPGYAGYNVARGVAVNTDPNAGAAFGRTYVSGALGNTNGQGLFALTANGVNAVTGAATPIPSNGNITWAASTSSPWRSIKVGDDGNVYIPDFSDAHADTFRLNRDLVNTAGVGSLVFANINTAAGYTAGTNHGNAIAMATTGTEAAGNLVMYTLDEDYPDAAHANATVNILKYNIGGAIPSTGFAGTPTVLVSSATGGPLGSTYVNSATSDLQVSHKTGNLYLTQNRASGTTANEFSLDIFKPDGSLLYNSQAASTTYQGTATGTDFLRSAYSIAISPDESYMAIGLTTGSIDVVPLNADGTPNFAAGGILTGFTTTTTTTSTYRIYGLSFDAAGNLYADQPFDGKVRVFSPGGTTSAITAFDGTGYSFSLVPEPTSLALLGLAGSGLLARRRRA